MVFISEKYKNENRTGLHILRQTIILQVLCVQFTLQSKSRVMIGYPIKINMLYPYWSALFESTILRVQFFRS